MQPFVHYFLHFGFPFILAFLFYRQQLWRAYGILVLTMLVDLDHLLARPIFDAGRCSIGFHPLHSHVAIAFYLAMLVFPRTRLVGVGLVLHMVTDTIDCMW